MDHKDDITKVTADQLGDIGFDSEDRPATETATPTTTPQEQLDALPRCLRCRLDAPAGARFCMRCGRPLQAPAVAAAKRTVSAVQILDGQKFRSLIDGEERRACRLLLFDPRDGAHLMAYGDARWPGIVFRSGQWFWVTPKTADQLGTILQPKSRTGCQDAALVSMDEVLMGYVAPDPAFEIVDEATYEAEATRDRLADEALRDRERGRIAQGVTRAAMRDSSQDRLQLPSAMAHALTGG